MSETWRKYFKAWFSPVCLSVCLDLDQHDNSRTNAKMKNWLDLEIYLAPDVQNENVVNKKKKKIVEL